MRSRPLRDNRVAQARFKAAYEAGQYAIKQVTQVASKQTDLDEPLPEATFWYKKTWISCRCFFQLYGKEFRLNHQFGEYFLLFPSILFQVYDVYIFIYTY